jgi:hypothetical protein
MDHAIRWLAIGDGPALTLAGWLLLRRVAGAPLRWSSLLLLDLFLPACCFGLVLAATARPGFAGIITLTLAAGFAYANRAKLQVLAEPVVFTDVFQAFDIFRHPQLALPFPNKGAVLLCVAAVVGFFSMLFALEAPAWHWTPWPLPAAAASVAAVAWLLGRSSTTLAAWLREAGLSGEPDRDAALCGTLGALLAYGIVARGERRQRQARAQPPAAAQPAPEQAAPVVLVQCESFFDARRLSPAISRKLLPHFDQLLHGAAQWGRLEVPCWGANTVRSEFAVLTGLPESAIGFDRFNPYHRFCDTAIDSLAWRLKAEGYYTVCVHPFDRRFYSRDRVLPNLGFDEFLGEEAFAGARRSNGYVGDAEVARCIAKIVAERGPKVFVFAITMENHGPWNLPSNRPVSDLLPDIGLPEGERVALERYLQGLRSADEMLAVLAAAPEVRRGVLAFYGDHLPAFRTAFEAFALDDFRSDYLICDGSRPAAPAQHDIQASGLADAILQVRARTATGRRGPRSAARAG